MEVHYSLHICHFPDIHTYIMYVHMLCVKEQKRQRQRERQKERDRDSVFVVVKGIMLCVNPHGAGEARS